MWKHKRHGLSFYFFKQRNIMPAKRPNTTKTVRITTDRVFDDSRKHPKLFVEMERGENNWYWSAHHYSNHKSMAIGGEGYRKRSSCLHGINTVFGSDIEIHEVWYDQNKRFVKRIK